MYEGPKTIRVKDVPEPKVAKNYLLLAMKNASICGTDLHFYKGEWRAKKGIILGHDASGQVEESGERVALEFIDWCGSCSFCRGGRENLCAQARFRGFDKNGFFAQRIVLPGRSLYTLPNRLGFEEAACLEPAALAVHTLNTIRPKANDWITVIGQGAVGLCMVQVASLWKCRVIAVDLFDYRLDLAKRFGADHTINAEEEDTVKAVRRITKEGSRFVIESAGSRSTVEQTPKLVRADGRVALVGESSGKIKFKDEALFSGITAYTISEKRLALKMVANGSIDLKSLIPHRYSLGNFKEAIKTALNPSQRATKILLRS